MSNTNQQQMQMNNEEPNDRGPDYEKYASEVINNLHNKGIDFATDFEAVEEEARSVAEMLVLDPDKLVEASIEKAEGYEIIGSYKDMGVE